ncbi:hypothetical protein ACIPSJ_26920 [Streptomyces sp. NPDC090088]|uniref:hypothetical protein n=1 Tax=Streptomyces sp. NPDC090088 TaxID=3365944 RepID=UPI0038238F6B
MSNHTPVSNHAGQSGSLEKSRIYLEQARQFTAHASLLRIPERVLASLDAAQRRRHEP